MCHGLKKSFCENFHLTFDSTSNPVLSAFINIQWNKTSLLFKWRWLHFDLGHWNRKVQFSYRTKSSSNCKPREISGHISKKSYALQSIAYVSLWENILSSLLGSPCDPRFVVRCMTGPILSALQIVSHLIFITSPWGKNFYYSHFTEYTKPCCG